MQGFSSSLSHIPNVMTFNMHDPSGASGIAADIETFIQFGCHGLPIISAITAQDTHGIKDFIAQPATSLIEQARVVLNDITVHAFKVAMLGTIDNIIAVATVIKDYPTIPVIFDPCLDILYQYDDYNAEIIPALREYILPLTNVCVIKKTEAQALSTTADSLDACAQDLMAEGCDYVMLSKVEKINDEITNILYGNRRVVKAFTWPYFDKQFIGSGTTLSAAVSALVAQQIDMLSVATQAQIFTWRSLKNARRIGLGFQVPTRCSYLHKDEH